MTRLIVSLYDFFARRRWLLWVVLCVVVVLSALAASRLRFSEDIAGFLPVDSHNERVNWAYSQVGTSNKIVVTVSMSDSNRQADTDLLIEAVDSFVAAVEGGEAADCIEKVVSCVDSQQTMAVADFVQSNMAYYLDKDDYVRIDSMLTEQAVKARLEGVKSVLMSPASAMIKHTVAADPLMLSGGLLSELQALKPNDKFKVIDDYLFIGDYLSAVVTIQAKAPVSDTRQGKLLTEAIDKAAGLTEQSFEQRVKIEPFGAAYIALDNSEQLKSDSVVSVAIAVVLIVLLLVLFFRDAGSMVYVALSILFGGLFVMGLMALIVGKVSLIAVAAGAIIVGIAANYPLHFVSHLKQGYSVRESLTDIVKPLTTGNITTVGAFLSLLFISSPAMRDLGLFASLLLLGTILFVLVFLPHIADLKPLKSSGLHSWGGLSSGSWASNRWIVLGVVVVTVVLSFFDHKVGFDANMQSINYMTEQHRKGMGRMLDMVQGGEHLCYWAVEGGSIDEALERREQLQSSLEGVLTDTSLFYRSGGIGRFLPSEAAQRERTQLWNSFWGERRDRFLPVLRRCALDAGFRDGAFEKFEELVSTDFEPQPIDHFETISELVASNYIIGGEGRYAVLTLVNANPDKAEEVEAKLNGIGGDSFAFDSGSVTRRMVVLLSADFDWVLYVCGLIVLVLLAVSFGRLELSLISFLPLAVSWIWILGIMGALGIGFNIINIILATFIFGMGDDYTIFITEGLMYEYAYRRKMLATYKSTVMLSALIMFAGIGSLIVARHPALRSLAEVTIVGMFSVVVMAYIIPPFFFRFLTQKRGQRREVPLTIKNLTATAGAFMFFLFGSVYITLAGFVLLTLLPRNDRNRLRYHRVIKSVAGVAFRNVFFTRHKIELNGHDFSRPSIIISNHQSHLDLMALLMLSERIVVVTNRWVWHSPFYGWLIRYADFVPIDNMLTDDLSHLEQMIERGYSVLIFPEGTRSLDGSIGRFHRGAFYLAERYGLDVVPVMLHGLGYVLPKSDLLLRTGVMSVEVMEPIKADDRSWGTCYVERSKAVRAMYVERYEEKCKQVETADYYADRVIHNYIYKGADVERYVRRAMRRNGNYRSLVESLPTTGRVLIVDDEGYGQAALVASLVRRDLTFCCVVNDDMRRDLASFCQSVPPNLSFVAVVDDSKIFDRVINV